MQLSPVDDSAKILVGKFSFDVCIYNIFLTKNILVKIHEESSTFTENVILLPLIWNFYHFHSQILYTPIHKSLAFGPKRDLRAKLLQKSRFGHRENFSPWITLYAFLLCFRELLLCCSGFGERSCTALSAWVIIAICCTCCNCSPDSLQKRSLFITPGYYYRMRGHNETFRSLAGPDPGKEHCTYILLQYKYRKKHKQKKSSFWIYCLNLSINR